MQLHTSKMLLHNLQDGAGSALNRLHEAVDQQQFSFGFYGLGCGKEYKTVSIGPHSLRKHCCCGPISVVNGGLCCVTVLLQRP